MNITQPQSLLQLNSLSNLMPSTNTNNSAQQNSAPEQLSLEQTKSTQNKKVDFTNMTIDELRNWVANQSDLGKITFEESMAFINIGRVQLQPDGTLTSSPDRVNFLEIIDNGIQNATENNDQFLLKQLQLAMGAIQRYLGSNSIDSYA